MQIIGIEVGIPVLGAMRRWRAGCSGVVVIALRGPVDALSNTQVVYVAVAAAAAVVVGIALCQ